MPAKTFFALLSEGHKLEVYDMKQALTVSAYPHMEEDSQEGVKNTLVLPDDILSDILMGENPDDAEKLKEAINGN